MKRSVHLNFRTQISISFAAIICFILASVFVMMHFILLDSYRKQESQALENHNRQVLNNLDNRLAYFQSYLQLLTRDKSLINAMETENYEQVTGTLKLATSEFMKLNIARVSAIRLFRSGIYGTADGLGDIHAVLVQLQDETALYPNSMLITGCYLNDRNEKVFSVFQKVYQTNENRVYFLEMCIYETEIFGFFNEEDMQNKVYVFSRGNLLSMNDRQKFSGLLYRGKGQGPFHIKKTDLELSGLPVQIVSQSQSGLEVLNVTSNAYLERGYWDMLFRMAPVFIAVLLIASSFAALFSGRLQRRMKGLQEKIKILANWNLTENLQTNSHDEFGVLADELDDTRKRILSLIEQNMTMNEQMRIAEMSALRAQINSHFLFNSLSSIKWLSKSGNAAELSETVDSLALFLRYSLSFKENQAPLENEVMHLKAYIRLQKLRYADEVNVQVDIDEDLFAYKTVKLILQPLVENAIYHGRRANAEPLNITIYSNTHDGCYDLIVEDDGKGMDPLQLRELQSDCTGGAGGSLKGYGLRNVIQRVKMCLDESGSVVVESRQNYGASITISQPMQC